MKFAENWSCGIAVLLFSSGLSMYDVKFTFPWDIPTAFVAMFCLCVGCYKLPVL